MSLDFPASTRMDNSMPGSHGEPNDQKYQQQFHPVDIEPSCIFKESLPDALEKLPHLTKEEATLVDLYNILDKV